MSINIEDTYTLGRAWRYTNPLFPYDILPDVYGDLTDGVDGNWRLPCIDTVNNVYCYAGTPVLSVGNGNAITIYEDGMLLPGAFYTFDESNDYEGQGNIATITFSTPKANAVITATGKGRADGATLIENPVEIIADFICNLAGGETADFNAYALQRAKTTATDYKAAGLITGDRSIGTTLSEILSSFYGDWWINHQGKIMITMNVVDQTYDWKGEIYERALDSLVATRDAQNICNQAEVDYLYNFAAGKYKAGDGGSTTADQLSQNIHGVKLKIFEMKWCRDATTVTAIQTIIVNRLKNPIWIISFDEVTLENIHYEKGDFVLFNHSTLYDDRQNEFENRIVQILTKVINYDDKDISFEIIDKGVSYHHHDEYPTDIINITEVIAKSVTKNVTESVAITETITKAVTKALTDGVSITETITKYVVKNAAEGVAVTEHAWKNAFQHDGVYDHSGSIRYGADYGVLS